MKYNSEVHRSNIGYTKDSIETKTSKEEDLVEQPKFRTLQMQVDDTVKNEADRSMIGITASDQWPDVLQEKVSLSGLSEITIRGITHTKFIITFESTEVMCKENIQVLSSWFIEIKKWNHVDLVQPRLAWLYCEGLPISAWNETNLKRITQDWGQLISNDTIPLVCNMYQNRMIAIYTPKVMQIDETIKVMIEGKGFWVRLKEIGFCFDSRDIRSPSKEFQYDNSFDLNSVSDLEVIDNNLNDARMGRVLNNNFSVSYGEDGCQSYFGLASLSIEKETNQNLPSWDNLDIIVPNMDSSQNYKLSSKKRDLIDHWDWRDQMEEISEESNKSDNQQNDSDLTIPQDLDNSN